MKKRVWDERKDKAKIAEYKIRLGKHLYGPHVLMDERNKRYDITIWDFQKETGYIDNIDWKTNKLGTTKHIMYLINYILCNPSKAKILQKSSQFIEIVTDPLNEYLITFKYNGKVSTKQIQTIEELFGKKTHLTVEQLIRKMPIFKKIQDHNDFIIRADVYDKLEVFFDKKEEEKLIKKHTRTPLNFSFLKAKLFPYQEHGIEYCVFKKGAILADEMGLGKTIQAMSIAILKRQYYGFKKTLIICPASVKYQWQKEIEKFTDDRAIVVDGFPQTRAALYQSDDYFFYIINYETVLRDKLVIDASNFEFIILDEAQKIKNYESKVSKAITELKKKHGLVITGTPIENKLIDIYSILLFVDKYRITPLWEFSYTHCIFDFQSKNKINGYYNLMSLNETLKDIVIRRQKKNVLKDLPSVIEQNVFLNLHAEQEYIHTGFKGRLATILGKKFKTAYDWDQIMLLLTNMRRVSNSTFLIDKKTNYSSKIIELEQILFDQMNLQNENRKIIIFSEWIDTLHLIEDLLNKYKVGFTKLIGKVNPKKRGLLVKTFEDNAECKVFLSTEAGGSGLNLQVADTLINFEIPWNPSKKNQRIGRIDRIGQKSKKLHIFNFICRDSIEVHIASGLLLKQTLFDSVLGHEIQMDTVDFSQQGRAQFIHQLEQMFLVDNEIDSNEGEIIDIEGIDFSPEHEISGEIEMASDIILKTSENDTKAHSLDHEKMEEIMKKGMEFLSGMYEMATGQKLGGPDGHKIEIDKSTGEIIMRFKL